MITFTGVSKSFSTPEGNISILDTVSLTFEAWTFSCIMWPSGTGKTTFLNLIAGLESPQQWSISVQWTDISTLSDDQKTRFRGEHISFIFQQFYLLPQLTVEENIDLVIELNKLERRFTTAEILQKVGLGNRAHAYPSTLSGGEQQRVAIARAFAGKTPILLADEPTGNLDQTTAYKIMDLMRSLQQEVGNTIIMITHDPHMASYAQQLYTFENHQLHLQPIQQK